MTKKINIEKFMVIKIFLIVLLILSTSEFCLAVTLSNLSVSPSSVAAGAYLTVSFDINSGAGVTSYYVVAISPFTTFDCSGFNTTAPTVYYMFVVNADGVYDSSMSAPDYVGPDSEHTGAGWGYGISISTGGSTQTLTYVIKVPPDAPTGNLYVHVVAHDWSINAYPTSCDAGNTILNSSAISVTAIDDCRRLNLQMFRSSVSGPTSNLLQMSVVITNWGIWPVPINGLKYRWYFYDTYGSYCCANDVPANNNETYEANGRAYLGQVGTVVQSWTNTSTANCSGSRNANWYVEAVLSGTVGQVIPGGGGKMATHDTGDTGLRFHRSDWSDFDYSDDYSRYSDFGVGRANANDSKYVTLYDSSSNLLWEYTGWSTLDPNTGEEPCGVRPTISVCGEQTIHLIKTVDRTVASLGDTITYCITYINNTGSIQTFNLWDTIPTGVTSFIGCDNSCSTTTIGGKTIVYWTISNLANGGSGTVCFWVEVVAFPENFFGKENMFVIIKRKFGELLNLSGWHDAFEKFAFVDTIPRDYLVKERTWENMYAGVVKRKR